MAFKMRGHTLPGIKQRDATNAEEEYKEQLLKYGTSDPIAREEEDTIGEGARSIIKRSGRFNVE